MARTRIGYNQDGRKLGTILPENEKKRRRDVFIKVVVCFVIDKNTGDILVEKRFKNGLLNPNAYDLVSGHIDGDEIGFQAMIRELSEEVGIGIEESSCNLKKIEEFTPIEFDEIGNYFVEFYCLLRNTKDGLKLQEEEVCEIEWKPMEEVFRMVQEGETRFPKDFDYTEIFKKVKDVYQGKKKEQQKSKE